MRFILRLLCAAGLSGGLYSFAQAQGEPKYGYEVVSIRKSDPAARGNRIGPGPQGGVRTTNTNLMTLLTMSYDVRDYQIIDAPGWAKTDGFDVLFIPEKPEALPGPGAGVKEMETMMDRQRQRMQAVLRNRFGLKLRKETRELPVYELNVAQSGSKLKTPEGGEGPSMQTNPETGDLMGVGVNMRMLTGVFSGLLGRPVVDRTGIAGAFDLKMHWKPDALVSPEGNVAAEVEGASIFTAVTEQLGLKLEPKKGPVTVYVVERVERPSEN